MAIELTHSEQQLIASICAAHRDWLPEASSAPRPVKLLEGGHSNRTVLLDGGGDRWVLRLAGAARPGVCRTREQRALRAASQLHLCPELRLCDPARGLLITRYVADRSAGASGPAQLATLLQRIHGIPWDVSDGANRQNPVAALAQYLSALPAGHALRQLLDSHGETLRRARTFLARPDAPAVLCHNDLLRGNRLSDGQRLCAIDWEYAGSNDPLFDLAVCAAEVEAPEDFARELLDCYLNRAARSEERQRLGAWLLLYRVLEALWFARHAATSLAGQASRQRLQQALHRELDID
jgi:thiamine kinase